MCWILGGNFSVKYCQQECAELLSMWPCLQILVVKKSLKLCLKSREQNCEKVPVKNFLATEQGLIREEKSMVMKK